MRPTTLTFLLTHTKGRSSSGSGSSSLSTLLSGAMGTEFVPFLYRPSPLRQPFRLLLRPTEVHRRTSATGLDTSLLVLLPVRPSSLAPTEFQTTPVHSVLPRLTRFGTSVPPRPEVGLSLRNPQKSHPHPLVLSLPSSPRPSDPSPFGSRTNSSQKKRGVDTTSTRCLGE